jgi:hypothetical protein|tara:strand:- start:1253 stop:1498 length:246 start_codon:yes stop_codon:yes gene_type:complete
MNSQDTTKEKTIIQEEISPNTKYTIKQEIKNSKPTDNFNLYKNDEYIGMFFLIDIIYMKEKKRLIGYERGKELRDIGRCKK